VRPSTSSDTLPVCPLEALFQGFLAGESPELGSAQMQEVLSPHISEQDRMLLHVAGG
jgi:hypothetical protein